MSHSNTPPARNPSPLTARSSSLRCVSAAEHQTAEQYSKTSWTKLRKNLTRSDLSRNTCQDFRSTACRMLIDKSSWTLQLCFVLINKFTFVPLSTQDGTSSGRNFWPYLPQSLFEGLHKLFPLLCHNFWLQGCAVADDIFCNSFRLPALAKIFAIESCSNAFHFPNVPWQIPLEKSKLHFPLVMKISFTNYENILIYFQSTTLHYKLLIQFFIQNTGQRMAPTNSYWYRKTLEGLKIFT